MFQNDEGKSNTGSVPEGTWIQNEEFYDFRRFSSILKVALAAFIIMLFSLAFIATGNPGNLLIMLLGLVILAITETGFFWSAQRIRISENGLQVQYYGPKTDTVFLWNEIGTIEVQEKSYELLLKRNRFLIYFRDRENRRMAVSPIAVFQDLCEVIRNTSSSKNPQIVWREL
ncbi:MAG: hypothetical protein KAR39_01295 [Thermoplasmata archaeon]|nr:hypothetical protein [Thermoplasmata archaeon]